MALHLRLLAAAFAILTIQAASATATEITAHNADDLTRATLDRYVAAWVQFSVSEIDALLHPEFQFFPFRDGATCDQGVDRATEMAILRTMFQGGEGGGPKFERLEPTYTVLDDRQSLEFAGGREVTCDVVTSMKQVDGREAVRESRLVFVLLPPTSTANTYQIRRISEVLVNP